MSTFGNRGLNKNMSEAAFGNILDDGSQPSMTKEQQLKLLTDILGKIENLESKVKSELQK